MKNVLLPLIHLLTVFAKLLGRGGIKGIIAENLLLKQQLLVVCRPRQRAPNLLAADRFLLGLFSLFLRPGRIEKTAVGIQPSTLLRFHDYLCVGNIGRFTHHTAGANPGPKARHRNSFSPLSNSNAGIHALAVSASRESSRKLLVLRLTETSCGVFSRSITTHKMAGMVLLG